MFTGDSNPEQYCRTPKIETMVEEKEKLATTAAKEERDKSSSTTNNHQNAEDLDVEEGEIVGNEPDDAAKAVAPPPAKHPLEHSWTFWFDHRSTKDKQAPWGSSICSIYTFSTVEDFWSVYNNIHRPSKLGLGADFHCFKNKIEPKWEDPVCSNGGKWTMTFQKGKSDTCWLYTLLAMIGEQFDYGDEICGAVVNVRNKQDKISIWTKNAANEVAQVSIGRQWKEFLDYNETIGFIFHEDAKKHERGAKNRYQV